jgi:hypothetical protein
MSAELQEMALVGPMLSPMYDPECPVLLIPHLVDVYATSFTLDALDYRSTQLQKSDSDVIDFDALNAHFNEIDDKRGFIACELLQTEENYLNQLVLAQNVSCFNLVL